MVGFICLDRRDLWRRLSTRASKSPEGCGITSHCSLRLFFQVGKKEFRETYWQGNTQASKVERVQFLGRDVTYKMGHRPHRSHRPWNLTMLFNASLSRMSLLTQTSNVVDLTPRVVPYQYGRLYSYMAVTWIPRIIWPDKPSMSEANRFYQVAYGLNNEEELEGVAIGVGVMTEAYISFGWFGVIGIMFLMGVFYDLYQRTFFGKMSGGLMFCIGVALIPQMIGIEAQMAGYLGGIVQQVILTLIVFLPVMRLSKARQESNSLSSTRRYPPYENAPVNLLRGEN